MKLSTRENAATRRVRRRERVLKTVGVLPSLATLGNLCCGFGAIYLCLLHAQATALKISAPPIGGPKIATLFPSFVAAAAFLLLIGMFFDAIDGRLARLARKTSEFGAQLDSLADVISFGVAPAFMVLCISQPATFVDMESLSFGARAYWRTEWVMAAIYACCAALRLARFNVENEEDESAHMDFRGLPTPGAAGAIVGLVLFQQGLAPALPHPAASRALAVAMPAYALALGLLMVSPFRYPHMINAILRGRRPFPQVVSLAILVLIAFVVEFQLTFAAVTTAYALSGPAITAFKRWKGRPLTSEPMVDELDALSLESPETFEDAETASRPDDDDDAPDHVRHTG